MSEESGHNTLKVTLREGEEMGAVMADLLISPELNAGIVSHAFTENTLGQDVAGVTHLVDSLKSSTGRVNEGDLSTLEAMLVSQATALQAIFTSYARRAQVQKYQKNLEAFMGLALRAQAQSRATIQALVDLKFPRQATFVKQANIANGPQQVNNGIPADNQVAVLVPSRSPEEIQTAQTKLFEGVEIGGKNLDSGAAAAAARSNRAMEALDRVHRAQKPRRKGQGKP